MWLHPSESGTRRDHVVKDSRLCSWVDLAIQEHRNAQGIGLTRADVHVPGFSEVIQPLKGKKGLNIDLTVLILITHLDVVIQGRVPVITSENLLAAHLLPAQITKARR